MNARFEAGQEGGHGNWGVWDNTKEEWAIPPTLSATEHESEEHTNRLNENTCALCGEQCDEAHANVRVGRVCENCADHRLDENGEVKDAATEDDKDYVVTLTVPLTGSSAKDVESYVWSKIAVVEDQDVNKPLDFHLESVCEETVEYSFDEAVKLLSEVTEFLVEQTPDPEWAGKINAAMRALTRVQAALRAY